jgi:tetratricopeptide (TPR) repeat protein
MELESLLDKSLVYEAAGADDEPRYRFSDPTREFAISQTPDFYAVEMLDRKHFEYVLMLAGASKEAPDPSASYATIATDVDNVRAALDWALRYDHAGAAALTLELTQFWRARSAFSEGRLWIERSIALQGTDVKALATLGRHAAAFAVMQDDYESAQALAEAALSTFRVLQDEAGIGSALHTLAEIAHRQGRFDKADRLYRDAFDHLRLGDHQIGSNICLVNRSLLSRQRGDFRAARALLAQAETASANSGQGSVLVQILIERGWLALCETKVEEAHDIFRSALSKLVERSDLYGACQCRLGLGTALLMTGHPGLAKESFGIALRDAYNLGAPIFSSDALFGLAAAYSAEDQYKAAAVSYAIAESLSTGLRLLARRDFARQLANERLDEKFTAAERAATVNDQSRLPLTKLEPETVLALLHEIGESEYQ